jgi:hypothetical protein
MACSPCQQLALTPSEVLSADPAAQQKLLSSACRGGGRTYEVRRLPGAGDRFEIQTVE